MQRRYRRGKNHMPADKLARIHQPYGKNDRILKMRHVDDLVARREALALYEDCKAAKNARITAVGKRTEEIGAPALYNLAELQKRREPLPRPDGHTGAGDCTEPVREEADFLSAHLQSPVAKAMYMTRCRLSWRRCSPARSSDNTPVWLTLPRRRTALGHKDTMEHHAPSSSQAYSPVNWAGRKCWFTRSCRQGA